MVSKWEISADLLKNRRAAAKLQDKSYLTI
jgi:hypothetical protein